MNENEHETSGVVIPLNGASVGDVDPWRLLAEQRGMLVTWSAAPSGIDSWGPALQAGNAMSEHLARVLEQAGQSRPISSGPTLFRIELPSGRTLHDLVPAVGGGYRGLVRAGGDPAIAGHVRLMPNTGQALKVASKGPMIALMALSVGAEMLARHQQDLKLEAIRCGVQSLKARADEQVNGQLRSAEQALEQSSAAILDRSEIPSSIGLGTSRSNIRDIKHMGLQWLEKWESGAAKLEPGKEGVDFGEIRRVLGMGEESQYKDFFKRVEWLYQALVLDSRAIVLTGAEAALKVSQPLENLEPKLRADLQVNAEHQERLKALLIKVAAEPVSFPFPTLSPSSWSQVADLGRNLAHLAATACQLPDALPLLNSSNRQVTRVLRDRDGKLRVLTAAPS